jgi:hypothetical protein
MKPLGLACFVLACAALLARAQDPAPQDVRHMIDLRADVVAIDFSGSEEKVGSVTFDPPMRDVPVLTATVSTTKAPDEYAGVFAVSVRDVTREGFRYSIQEADSQLRWGRGLLLNWIAVVQER